LFSSALNATPRRAVPAAHFVAPKAATLLVFEALSNAELNPHLGGTFMLEPTTGSGGSSHDISVLNGLIETTIDSVDGYRRSAQEATNSRFSSEFLNRANEREQVVSQLRDEVRRSAAIRKMMAACSPPPIAPSCRSRTR
jgi:hypothetical protein